MSLDFINVQIAALEATITAYNAAILALTETPIVSYTLNTGQGSQTVARRDLDKMTSARNRMMGELDQLCTLRDGDGSPIMTPAF
ncbi:MAG: hypothetical protein KAJ19_12995 [Gammaproteobacteria bacterium]|nr:hypothetical protein [Gammaproteobacteria bacterium]